MSSLLEVEQALAKLRQANADYFNALKSCVGKQSFRKVHHLEGRINAIACKGMKELGQPLQLVNDLGQVAVRGERGEFLHWDAVGAVKDLEKQKREPPIWAKDFSDET